MYGHIETIPPRALIEEVSFNLGAGASRNGVTIDGRDWVGTRMPDFSDNRQFGFPVLEGAILAPGNANVVIQYAVPTFPIAEPPVLTFSAFQTIGALGGAWTEIRLRVGARFSRVVVTDTSGGANNGIYLVLFVTAAPGV